MKIKLNGEWQSLAPVATLAEVLRANGIAEDAKGVAVALNEQVVPRPHWAHTPVRELDAIEIVTARPGG